MAKKIYHLTTVHLPFDTRIFFKQAKTLVQRGYDVTLVAQHEGNTVVDGIQIIGLPKPRNRFIRIFGLTWEAFRLSLRQRAYVYHFHDPELLPVGILLKLFTQKKVIYDVHEDVPEDILIKEWIPRLIRKPLAWIFKLFEQFAIKFMDKIITATDSIAAHFPSAKVVVVRNYPCIDLVNNVSLLEDSTKNYCTLIYVGILTEERGIYELVRSLEFIDSKFPVRLKFIGKFDPPTFENRIRSLSTFTKVDYLGWLPYEEAIAHLKNADIGIVLFHPVPNHPESSPNKLFEYMAVGLPVIASNFPLWKEIIEGNHCGLTVNPLDPKEIASAIEYFITHPDEARRMGENGRRVVLNKYNWEKESEKLLAVYKSLLENGFLRSIMTPSETFKIFIGYACSWLYSFISCKIRNRSGRFVLETCLARHQKNLLEF